MKNLEDMTYDEIIEYLEFIKYTMKSCLPNDAKECTVIIIGNDQAYISSTMDPRNQINSLISVAKALREQYSETN